MRASLPFLHNTSKEITERGPKKKVPKRPKERKKERKKEGKKDREKKLTRRLHRRSRCNPRPP
jgi:hypothetical protein